MNALMGSVVEIFQIFRILNMTLKCTLKTSKGLVDFISELEARKHFLSLLGIFYISQNFFSYFQALVVKEV